MAIAPTGDIYKALTFDNKSSRNYGVYITGEAVYNAPERDVEMITIPGRNGTFALDNGRFQNIEVSYPASIAADTEADFISAISEFRNFLCSKKGYCRLSDDYNPNEYRMAVYKSGLEVEPAQLRAGEFKITFDCKPQRFLTSGETAVTVADGGTLTNPTLFESSPLLVVKGYGDMTIGDYQVSLQDVDLGYIRLLSGITITGTSRERAIPSSLVESGNPEYVSKVEASVVYRSSKPLKSAEITNSSGYVNRNASVSVNGLEGYLSLRMNDISYATATTSKNCHVTITFTADDDTTTEVLFYLYAIYTRIALPNYDSYEIKAAQTDSGGFVLSAFDSDITLSTTELTAVSTASALGNPTYIDCDIGEAYKIVNNNIISLNHVIDLGSKLPTLMPGSNEFTYDNTYTEVKVTPRWWKV